jgi:phosphatidylglycerol:prolipoprotein diacylglycerol transferase
VGQKIALGYLKGAMYARFKEFSIGRLADVSAPALLIAQTIGRIGDIINGEHVSVGTDLPWGFVYSHQASPSFQLWGLTASQPVIAYEMLWNMVVLAAIWRLRGRLAPPGMLFALYLMLYSLGRFFIQFLRLDKPWFAGLQEAHLIALVVLAITVPLLAYKARFVKPAPAPAAPRRTSRRARGKG